MFKNEPSSSFEGSLSLPLQLRESITHGRNRLKVELRDLLGTARGAKCSDAVAIRHLRRIYAAAATYLTGGRQDITSKPVKMGRFALSGPVSFTPAAFPCPESIKLRHSKYPLSLGG